MARYTLRRKDRIPEGEDFVQTARRGRATRAPHLRVHARANGLGYSRLGVSVGRRFGTAVQRNRFKRLVREAFRTSNEVRAAGLDLVVVAQDRGALDSPEEIARTLSLAVERFGRGREGRRRG